MSKAAPSFTVDELKSFALSLGFMACGITDLSPTPHGDVLDRWLASGYGGVMRYLNHQSLAVSFHAGKALHHPGGLGILTVVELEPHRQHLVG